MADGDVAAQGGQGLLVEHLGHQSEVLEHDDLAAVGDGDTGRFLAAVLQRVEAVVGQFGDFLAGRPDAEDAALLLRSLVGRRIHLRIPDDVVSWCDGTPGEQVACSSWDGTGRWLTDTHVTVLLSMAR